MDGAKYILTAIKYPTISIVFQFDLNGLLCAFKLEGDYTPKQHEYLIHYMPKSEQDVRRLDKAQFRISKQQADLSFERFWTEYDYKMKKVMSEKSWSKLSEADRSRALIYIPFYNQHCKVNQIQKAYPSTYLNQRYFDV